MRRALVSHRTERGHEDKNEREGGRIHHQEDDGFQQPGAVLINEPADYAVRDSERRKPMKTKTNLKAGIIAILIG